MHRSLLYVPANRPDRFDKALATPADAIILDLEDAVPQSEKDAARELAAAWLATGARSKPVMVRVNTGEIGLADVARIARAGRPDTILVPKAEDASHLARLGELLDGADCAARLQPIIESAIGVDRLGDIASASSRVIRFSFGAGDFVADIGARHTPERSETFLVRSTLVLQSRQLRLEPPVAHVVGAFRDDTALRRASIEDRALGFGGRTCIHPRQVGVVNEIFGPTHSEIAQAQTIIAAADAKAAMGIGAFALPDGMFIDEAVVRHAKRLLSNLRPET